MSVRHTIYPVVLNYCTLLCSYTVNHYPPFYTISVLLAKISSKSNWRWSIFGLRQFNMFLPLTAVKLESYFTSQCLKSKIHNFGRPNSCQLQSWKSRDIWEICWERREQITVIGCNSQANRSKVPFAKKPEARDGNKNLRDTQVGVKVWLFTGG